MRCAYGQILAMSLILLPFLCVEIQSARDTLRASRRRKATSAATRDKKSERKPSPTLSSSSPKTDLEKNSEQSNKPITTSPGGKNEPKTLSQQFDSLSLEKRVPSSQQTRPAQSSTEAQPAPIPAITNEVEDEILTRLTDNPEDYRPAKASLADKPNVIFALHIQTNVLCVRKCGHRPKDEEHLQNEINHLTTLNQSADRSPFIVRLYHSFRSEGKIYEILEYVMGDNLTDSVKKGKIQYEHSRDYVGQMVLGLRHVHRHGIVYNDLKLDNFVISPNGRIVLIDFGGSKTEPPNGERIYSYYGCLPYDAPEKILHKKVGYNRMVDFFSLGASIFAMYCNQLPFHYKYHYADVVSYGKLTLPTFCKRLEDDPDASDLVLQLLVYEPDKRLGAHGGADDVMKHPFFTAHPHSSGADFWQQLEAKYREIQARETAEMFRAAQILPKRPSGSIGKSSPKQHRTHGRRAFKRRFNQSPNKPS